jgi:hypothetical protein
VARARDVVTIEERTLRDGPGDLSGYKEISCRDFSSGEESLPAVPTFARDMKGKGKVTLAKKISDAHAGTSVAEDVQVRRTPVVKATHGRIIVISSSSEEDAPVAEGASLRRGNAFARRSSPVRSTPKGETQSSTRKSKDSPELRKGGGRRMSSRIVVTSSSDDALPPVKSSQTKSRRRASLSVERKRGSSIEEDKDEDTAADEEAVNTSELSLGESDLDLSLSDREGTICFLSLLTLCCVFNETLGYIVIQEEKLRPRDESKRPRADAMAKYNAVRDSERLVR